jgi:hypothetical protein
MKNKSTQELIIEILSNAWPLTTKQIYHRLKRNYAVSISYQAVHKHIKEMLKDKMIVKDNKKILLSYSYIKKLSDYAKRLESSFGETSEKGSQFIIFNSFIEIGKFLINKFMGNESGKYGNPENKDCVCYWEHAWPIVGASQEEHEKMKEMFNKTTHWNICANDTFLDKITSNYVKKIGKKVVLKQRMSIKPDTFVEGDYILQAHFPKKLEHYMNKLYNRVKNEKDFDMKEMFEFGSRNYEIKVVIFKNKELADSLREEAKKLYQENKKNRVIAKKGRRK